ncbi:hemagglutinin repeat-containing protein, partial [Litoricolaceae bacterium]|nr:hemagglutinin repeat-containing protein [Litorivicinaceae bacterium]
MASKSNYSNPNRSTALRRYSVSAITAILVVALVPTSFGAGSFVADPSAALGFQPSIGASPTNSTPVITITAPSAGGISHNKFDTFNVGTEGVIHNNSTSGNETSVLDGGQIGANPNFSGTPAATIVDEVTTANTSSLEGALEVYGSSASLIIANPNGITCDGCSFINAPDSALTTGALTLDYTSGDIDIESEKNLGIVTIGAGGLDANNAASTDSNTLSIIAREIILNGGVEGATRVDLLGGANIYDFDAGIIDANGPSASLTPGVGVGAFVNPYQIDAAALGTIAAGKINIIGTEDGVGVRLRGDLDATGGGIVIGSDGALTTSGDFTATGSISLTTNESGADGVINNSGALDAGTTVGIDSQGDITNSGSIQSGTSLSINANANDFTNDGGSLTGTVVRVLNVGSLSNSGGAIAGIFTAANYTASGAGVSIDGAAGGLADALEDVEAVVSAVANGGVITVNLDPGVVGVLELEALTSDSGDAVADGQAITISGTGSTRTITITGTVEADDLFAVRFFGGVSLTASTITTSGDDAITSYGDITLGNSTSLTNSGEVNARGSLHLGTSSDRAGAITNTGSSALLASGQDINIYSTGEIQNISAAAIYSGQDINLDSDSNILNRSQGYIEASRNLTIDTATTTPYSWSESSSNVTHGAGTYFYNEEGTIYAGNDITINSGGFYNWRGNTAFSRYLLSGSSYEEEYRTTGGVWVIDYWTEYTAYFQRQTVDETYDTSATRASLLASGDIIINAERAVNEFSSIQATGDVSITAADIENMSGRTADGFDTKRISRYVVGGAVVYNTWDAECIYLTDPDNCSVGENRDLREIVVNHSDSGHKGIINSGATLTLTGAEVSNIGDFGASNVVVDAVSLKNGLDPGSNAGVDWASQVPAGFVLNGLYTVSDSGSFLVVSRVSSGPVEPVVTQEDLLNQLDLLWRPEPIVANDISAGNLLSLDGQVDLSSSEEPRNDENLRFLGDPFVEERYIRDQALQLTGEAFVVEETDDLSQQVAELYANAASFANERDDVFLGEALTEDQIAALQQPVVWYVNEIVLGEEVLVPRLYLPSSDAIEVTPAGQIIASNDIDINVDGDVTNTGLVRAGGQVDIQAENLVNETLTTVATATTQSGQQVIYETAGATATIEGGSVSLTLQSEDDDGGNLVNRGAAIRSTEGSIDIETSGDVINEALVVEQISDIQTDGLSRLFGQSDYARRSDFVGSSIESAADINITADGTVQNIASDIVGEGDVVVDGREGVEQRNLAEVYDTASGIGYREQAVENQSSSISGANVTLRSSEGDIVSIGSDISSDGETVLEAIEGDIQLLSDVQITESESLSFSGGGINYSREQNANFVGSNVSGNNVTLRAGGDVVGRGAQVEAENNVELQASNLDFRAAEAEVEGFAFGAGVSGTASAEGATAGAEVSVGFNATQSRGTQSQLAGISAGNNLSIDVDNDVTLVGVNVDAGADIDVDYGGDLEIAAQEDRTVVSGVGVGASVGVQVSAVPAATGPTASVQFGASTTDSVNVTQTAFDAGGNIRINGSGDARIAGVDVNAGGNIELDTGELTIETLSDRTTTTGFGVDLRSPNQIAAGRAPISVTSFNDSTNTIDAVAGLSAGGNLDINSTGAVTNRGGRLTAGESLEIDAVSLVNESLTETAVAQTGNGDVNYQTLGATATIEGGSVSLNITSDRDDQGNVVNRGGEIRSTEGALTIEASGDIINEALIAEQVSDVEVGNLGRLLGRQTFTKRADFIGGSIEGATDLTLDAGGEVVNIASDIAATDDVLISADEGFYQQNLADVYTLEDSINLGGSSSSSSSAQASASGDSFGSFEASAEANAEGSQDLISGRFRQGFNNRSASVSGGNVTIVSERGDVTSVGSDISSVGETVIEATEGDINLIADAIITQSSSFALSAGGSASASAGGSGLSYRADASAEGGLSLSGRSQQTANFVNSTVSGNNVTLRAQNVQGVGAEVVADNNIAVEAENDVSFTAA